MFPHRPPLQLPGQSVATHIDGVYFWGASRFQFPQVRNLSLLLCGILCFLNLLRVFVNFSVNCPHVLLTHLCSGAFDVIVFENDLSVAVGGHEDECNVGKRVRAPSQ